MVVKEHSAVRLLFDLTGLDLVVVLNIFLILHPRLFFLLYSRPNVELPWSTPNYVKNIALIIIYKKTFSIYYPSFSRQDEIIHFAISDQF